MRPVIIRVGWRYISRRLFQSALFIAGVALGVAMVIAIDIANSSASRAFALSAESVGGRATHQIIGGPKGLDSSLYAALRIDLGLRLSAPIISEFVGVDGRQRALRLLGVDPLVETFFRPYLAVENSPTDRPDWVGLSRLTAEPDTVVISASLARSLGVQLNDALVISAKGRRRSARVIGIMQPRNQASRQALDDLIIADIATAQEIVGRPGRIHRIDLILDDNDDAQRIMAALPAGAALLAVSRESALDQMTAAFETNLQALSLLALVVGLFLIYNTVTFSVVQRRHVIGILRCLGASKAQIFAWILGEAFALGWAGAALGVGLGIIFGRGAVALVAQTISDLYFAVNAQNIAIDPLTLLKGAGIGLLASVIAALMPSYDAARTPPAGLMLRSSEEAHARRRLPFITAVAAGMNLLGLALLQSPNESLSMGFAALFFIVVGSALFTPAALLLGMRLLLPLISRLLGALGRMAARAIIRALSRTSVAVAALTIAVSVIVGVGAMIASFRTTVADWLDNSLGAQIFISPPLFTSNLASVDVDAAALELAGAAAGVRRVSAARNVTIAAPDYPDRLPVNVLASDFDIAGEKRRFKWTKAPPGEHQAALDAGQLMVSESFAFRRGITEASSRIALTTDRGDRSFDIFGVYFDYTTDQGTVYMSRAVYDQFFDDPFISTLAVFLEPDADPQSVISDLQGRLADFDLIVQDNASLRRASLEVFDRTFAITIALRLLTTAVAFIGILSALMAMQLERTREYGLMRAMGMTARQLIQFTLIQTGLMGLMAGLLALPIGAALSLALIDVINVRSFGWTMQFAPAPNEFAEAFLVAVAAAGLAGIYPALKIARLAPAAALRGE